MNKKEVVSLIEQIELFYNQPFSRNFNLNDGETATDKMIKLVEAWHRLLRNQDFKCVMRRFDNHCTKNKFPPTIADLYEEPSESKVNHEHLEYMRKLRSGSRD
ncbi:replicative helicase loader/inhibitor [Sutcliffiella sp. FSL R7-0096]|uniref:replicative helicase loader/inhibitor n=1 Tax=Sutcliffiella sp. FSL R7-0096 TaxID=2921670 RepID=UPI00315B0E3F